MSQFSFDADVADPADHAACRAAIRAGSKSFYAASLLLPPSVRRPAFGLYAFCRMSDDAIDLHGGSLGAMDRLRDRLERAAAGRPLPMSADRAMADVMRRFDIPLALPAALLEGLGWDAQGRRYDDLADLYDYAVRVAGTVGAMMSLIMGVREPEALARACDLGVAMQFTNIARDVGEDARAGRIYIPLDWLREAKIDPAEFLRSPLHSPAVASLVARLVAEAARLYTRALGGVAHLPPSCRPAILAAGYIYADIGREISARSYDSITQRAHVTSSRKAKLLLDSVVAASLLSKGPPAAALPAAEFLVDAARRASSPLQPARAAFRNRPDIRHQVGRVLEIFERLERSEQQDRA